MRAKRTYPDLTALFVLFDEHREQVAALPVEERSALALTPTEIGTQSPGYLKSKEGAAEAKVSEIPEP